MIKEKNSVFSCRRKYVESEKLKKEEYLYKI